MGRRECRDASLLVRDHPGGHPGGEADGRDRALGSGGLPRPLLEHGTATPGAIAIMAPGRVPLTYHGLCQHLTGTVAALQGLGIGPHDRVALLLPMARRWPRPTWP
jgi:hypothetical protein